MKILLAIDGSKYGEAAVRELAQRQWPAGTEVRVLSVAHPARYFPDPLLMMSATHFDSLKDEQERAARDVAAAADEIAKCAPALKVTTQVLEGSPKKVIVEEAERWKSDLIFVGSHGYGPTERFLLGSVAQAVVTHSPCSVEVVRCHAPAAA